MYDHLLIVGYGSPTNPKEMKVFLDNLTKDKTVSQGQVEQLISKYERIGFKTSSQRQLIQLGDQLAKGIQMFGFPVPDVYVGMLYSNPLLLDTMVKIRKKGHKRGLVIILSSYRSEATYDRYEILVDQIRNQAGAGNVRHEFIKSWHNHPLFIQATADQAWRTMRSISMEARESVHILFTAPAIPESMAKICSYERDIATTCSHVGKQLQHGKWTIAYQSGGGSAAGERWLSPNILSLMPEIRQSDKKVVCVPVGYLFEGLETNHDLDIEARDKASAAGLEYLRAPTVMDHYKFPLILLDLIQQVRQD